MSIAMVILSLIISAGLIFLEQTSLPVRVFVDEFVKEIEFSSLLLEGMLGLLLFAGALHVNLDDLAEQAQEISVYATLGIVASMFLFGTAIFMLSGLVGMKLSFLYCLVFGALISPTDPIAVLSIMRKAGAPKSLETRISGESLFNDGIGVVIFLVLLEIVSGGHDVGPGFVAVLFLKEAVGGLVFGFLAGLLFYRLLKSINFYKVEIMMTLALVVGGYELALNLHISAPLAMVTAGLLIGNHGRRLAMSDTTRKNLDAFWEMVDEILNALLFVLIGMEVLVVILKWEYILAGIIAIPVALFSRFISIGIPVSIFKRYRFFPENAVRIMTWGGLRGGISVALALSLPESPERDLILTMTFVVVIFSVVIQGLTIKYLIVPSSSVGNAEK